MDSKKFKSTIIIRVLLIILTSVLLYETLGGDNIFLTPILFLFLVVIIGLCIVIQQKRWLKCILRKNFQRENMIFFILDK